jgi:hypothetical protein
MRKIEEFVDERLQTLCIHCARPLADLEVNEDHVPSKSFLVKPRPHNLPIVKICSECNNSFSLDEQYAVTFLSCVLAGTTAPEKQSNGSAARALADSNALRTRIERSRTEYVTQAGETRLIWKPEVDRIERVVLKNARGHAYFEFGEPVLEAPNYVCFIPLENMNSTDRCFFEGLNDSKNLAGWPEVGSRMMTRLVTGEDLAGQWVIVQDGTYRYSVQNSGGLTVRSVIWEYLASEVHWE